MIENLKFLIDEIELFANAHANVERFAFEFEDQIDPLIQKSTLHPYMFVSPIDGYAVNQAMTQIGLRIKVLDIIEIQDRSNVKDILDNSLKVLQDFIAEFGEMNKDLLVEMPTISALNDYTPNYTAGYFIDANFYIIKRNNCDNFGGGTPPDFCKDATVNITNSDNDLLGSVVVPSGGVGSFEVPDENITVNGNLLVTKPSAQDYNVEVVDSENNPTGVISGGKVVVADTYSWKFQFIDQTDTIQIEVDATMLHTFASSSGVNIGTMEISTDGVNYVPISYPFTPSVGTLYFKRSTALITATYTMIQ